MSASQSRRRKFSRWAVALLLALVALELGLPTGCIGVEAVVGRKTRTATGVAYLTTQRPRAGGTAQLDAHGWRPTVPVYTSTDVLRCWGEPDHRRLNRDGFDEWTYGRRGLKWRGLWIWAAVVPIPVQIPTGRNKLRLEFAHDSLRRVTIQGQRGRFYGVTVFNGVQLGEALFNYSE